MIEFIVPAIPIAQPRQRTRVIQSNGKAFASNYTPKTAPVNTFKATVRMAAAKVFADRSPILGPIAIEVLFVMPRPKNQFWKSKPMPRSLHTKKPDVDNIFKAVSDALTGLLWLDDSQICDCKLRKMVAAGDEQPHVAIRLTVLDV